MAEGQVYLVGVLEGCYKIGRSGDSEKRLLSYSPKLPVTLTIHHRITTDDAPWLEAAMHLAFEHRRALGEWFRLTPDDLDAVKAMVSVRRDYQLPAPLMTLWQQHGGEPAMRIRPERVKGESPTEQQPKPTPAEPDGELVEITIGKVSHSSEGALNTGDVYTVRSGVWPNEGDLVITEYKGWHSLRRAKNVRRAGKTGRWYAELYDVLGHSYTPLDSLTPAPDKTRLLGVLEGYTLDGE